MLLGRVPWVVERGQWVAVVVVVMLFAAGRYSGGGRG